LTRVGQLTSCIVLHPDPPPTYLFSGDVEKEKNKTRAIKEKRVKDG
jgi:hypothetical protein